MQFSFTARAAHPALAYVIGLGALGTLLLGGCGGGGGINGTSSSSEGFRIVPAGGTVTPLTDSSGKALVTLATQPGVVSSGVEVSATAGAAPASVPVSSLGQTIAVPGGIYQIMVNPDNPAVGSSTPVVLTLAYSQAPPANSTLHIYRYDGTKWTVLPGADVTTGSTPAATGTVTAMMETVSVDANNKVVISPYLSSGLYAIFATAPPPPPPAG